MYIDSNPESVTAQLEQPEHHQYTTCVEALLVGPGRQEKDEGLSGHVIRKMENVLIRCVMHLQFVAFV